MVGVADELYLTPAPTAPTKHTTRGPLVLDPTRIAWYGSVNYHHDNVLVGLVHLMIDCYSPHPIKGNAYQIRIKGIRMEKVGTKLWLPDLDAAKNAAVHRLNELVESGLNAWEIAGRA